MQNQTVREIAELLGTQRNAVWVRIGKRKLVPASWGRRGAEFNQAQVDCIIQPIKRGPAKQQA